MSYYFFTPNQNYVPELLLYTKQVLLHNRHVTKKKSFIVNNSCFDISIQILLVKTLYCKLIRLYVLKNNIYFG